MITKLPPPSLLTSIKGMVTTWIFTHTKVLSLSLSVLFNAINTCRKQQQQQQKQTTQQQILLVPIDSVFPVTGARVSQAMLEMAAKSAMETFLK